MIGEKIVTLKKLKGLPQYQLGQLVDLDNTLIIQVERNRRKVTSDDLAYKDGRCLKRYSISTIMRCFAKLIDKGMVSISETEVGTLITVVN